MTVTGTAHANGAELYHEIRGSGPPLLFVSGATGDAGHWDRVVDAFARDHTVVTYDRRGNSRSPAPAGGSATSMEEQADDAAALLEALDLAPARVVGSSGGAVITLALLARRPDVVRAAVVHEPPLMAFAESGGAGGDGGGGEPPAPLREAIERAASGAPREALETFLHFAMGRDVLESLDPALRERVFGNARVFFERELDPFVRFLPDTDRLRRCGVPLAVAGGRATRDDPDLRFQYDVSAMLADRLGAPFRETTGRHVPYLSHPAAFESELRGILADLAG